MVKVGRNAVGGHALRVRLELGDLPLLELFGEPRVVRPEQADVGDAERHHGEALEAEAERPAVAVAAADVGEDVGVDHAAAEHLG